MRDEGETVTRGLDRGCNDYGIDPTMWLSFYVFLPYFQCLQ